MSSYSVAEIRRQTATLADDLPGLLDRASVGAAQALAGAPAPSRVVVLGSGDSLNAAFATRQAFATRLTAEYWPLTPSEFLDHAPPGRALGSGTTVVAVSASGSNPALLTATIRARKAGCRTIAVTGHRGSALAEEAEHVVAVELGEATAPSPGIRTYQGSLAGLLVLAMQLASGSSGAFVGVDGRLAAAVARSAEMAEQPVATLAPHLATAWNVVVVGFGPTLGTARHVATKVTESAACPAIGVELEDWWHVHRFGHARDVPVVALVTPGRGREAALAMARRTADRRPVAIVAAEDDAEAAQIGIVTIPVAAGVPEVARPFVDHVFAGLLAAELAQARAVVPFANP
jgi:glutamine---fructose-6-phosphate transaminase (isomerizing)